MTASGTHRWKDIAGRARQQSDDDLLSAQRKSTEPVEQWDAELCVRLLRAPTIHNYSSIRRRLERCSRKWMHEFLDLEGLGVLFESLGRLGSSGAGHLATIALQLECVACVRVVMSSKTGLDCIIEHEDYTKKLVFTLDTRNMAVKKQVFELLSALCLYSEKGHQLVIEALVHYKIFKGYRYRFSVLLNELVNAEVTPFKVSLLAFINCVILCVDELPLRLRLRDEFIVLGLLQILDSFRQEDDDQLSIQCQAFDDNRHNDEDVAESIGIHVHGNHFDIFQTIFKKVQDSPLALPFLLLLQNLSQLDPNSPESDQVWDLLEKVSARAANGGLAHLQRGLNFQVLVLNTRDESTQTPKTRRAFRKELSPERTAHAQTQTEPSDSRGRRGRRRVSPLGASCLSSDSGEEAFFDTYETLDEADEVEQFLARPFPENSDGTGVFRARPFPHSSLPLIEMKSLISALNSSPLPANENSTSNSSPSNIPPPPPPLPDSLPPFTSCSDIPPPPPPPPLPQPCGDDGLDQSLPPPPPPFPNDSPTNFPPPPPMPLPLLSTPLPPPIIPSSTDFSNSPFQRPNYYLFNPLSSSKDLSLARISPYATLPRPRHKMKTLNWTKVPSQNVGDSVWKAVHSENTPNIQLDYEKVEELFCQKQMAEKAAAAAAQKQKRENQEVNLFDGKRSLNLNIFLKQFKCSIEELINLVRGGRSDQLGAEKLRAFQKILPEREEIELVRSYTGDVTKLGTAEQFIRHLATLPVFALRVEALLQREEFTPSVESLRPQLEAILTTGNDLLTNKSLKEFLALVLHTGNFLNAGSYAGNAVGFKLNALSKLYETRANKPRVTLLHFLVDVAERENANMLNFTTDMKSLSQASKLSISGISSEINQLKNIVTKLERQLITAPADVKEQFQDFVLKSREQVIQLESTYKEITHLSSKLARHFCEDELKFKLEDCFSTFAAFCEKVKQARLENEQRKKQEERAAKMQEAKSKHKPVKRESSQFMPDEMCLVDKLLNEIRRGSFKLRKTPACT